ncbi:MAG: hypothetical protein KGJ90_02120 [Patescibacteria group bacterium]|nr:hypothetical protein [Patescibacteria group bacterium]
MTAPLPIPATFRRDGNYVPIVENGLVVQKSITLIGSGATVAVPLFSITGTVQMLALWGIVTTALGNNTAAYWRLNDATAQSNISLNTGTALTNAVAGSLLLRNLVAGSALTLLNATQEIVQDTGSSGIGMFTQSILVQKTGGVATNVEFVYTTSDTPTTGVITFSLGFYPISSDGNVTAV